MSVTPKLHRKLKTSKHATVSLDSLLGLLSSAYGIEELDSAVLFDKNKVNWKNLTVENLKAIVKKEETGDDQRKESEKISVSTSTTSLKKNKGSGREIDVTLVSIKSLESFKQALDKSGSDINTTDITKIEATVDGKQTTDEKAKEDVKQTDKNSNKDCNNMDIKEQPIICGFFIDDINQKLVFDIQFTKKTKKSEMIPDFNFNEPEVSINVTDISKRATSCVKLTKSCLVSNFQYFAEVDKEYGLENLDVTLECNLNVFQWIVQWVKADIVMCKPNLNLSILKNILSMVYHLRVENLLEECLDYFHANCENALGNDNDIEYVFDDELLSKYTSWISNSELDEMNDNFSSFKMKMFCSLIKLLVDPNPSTAVGHFSSLATIFQCGNCDKFLQKNMVDYITCRSDCMQMDYNGELKPHHEQSSSWDLSRYIELMFEELGSWRVVYWRLWGMCHFLTCNECYLPYPLSQSDWCPYHTTEVEYFPMNSNLFYPIGMYQCCGEKAFKFNTLQPYGGCKFRSHTPRLDSEERIRIFEIFLKHKHYISIQPVENVGPKKFVKLLKRNSDVLTLQDDTHVDSFWWQGILLAPKVKKDYSVIPMNVLNHVRNRPQENKCLKICKPLSFESQVHFGVMPSSTTILVVEKTMSENETMRYKKNKAKSSIRKVKSNMVAGTGVKLKKKKSVCSYQPTESVWSNCETYKDNQDNQRDFEEIAMRSLVNMLTPEFQGFTGDPVAGSYLRLEAQWWQEHSGDARSGKNSGTVVNRTFPLSWYRRLTL
ncbi:hypothetical protein J6590_014881 [Homalodisca vitripennis]|nr:hypothetical protein J6590_014881 [Homalodisca vitripennis]